jgi:hypothetical protein
VTIHPEHPFVPPESERDPLRRFRGRMAAPVTVWAHGSDRSRAGLTVSSMLVADGVPPRVLGLVDEDADFFDDEPELFTVCLLAGEHAYLAEAFAGTAPAPGGPFGQGTWRDSHWGPVLDGCAGWIGVRRDPGEPRHAGWALLVEGVVEHVEVGRADPLAHVRGRYRTLAPQDPSD